MRRIAIMNQKGGCGKTTTAVNLAGALAHRGLRTLLVDLDPQGHCAAGLAIPESRLDADIGEALLVGDRPSFDVDRLVWRIARRLDLAPSRDRLAAFDTAGVANDRPDRDWLLDRFLARVAPKYDVCVIDTNPGPRGTLARNALAAASLVLVPMETSYYALQSAAAELDQLADLGDKIGVQPAIHVLPSVFEQRVALARDLADELRRRVGDRAAPVVVRYDIAVKEAASFGQPVVDYSAQCEAATDFGQLAAWTIDQLRSTVEPRTRTASVRSFAVADAQREIARRVAIAGRDQHSTGGSEPMDEPAQQGVAARAPAIAIAASTGRPLAPAGSLPMGPASTPLTASARAEDLARTAKRMHERRVGDSFGRDR